jgi:hypothetical protein
MQKKPHFKRPLNEVDASNKRILDDRQERIDARRPILPDLELGLVKDVAPEPASATEFMDQFDKKAYGDGREATITKIIYGPDPLVDNCPAFREALERYGREDLAANYEEAILDKGVGAMPDRLMAKALGAAINSFGREAVAIAFRDRVLKIQFRSVEIDASDELDPEILGSSILGETVKRFERPGMEYRFFTKQCLDRFGWRGYTAVKENGDIVSAGTLMLGEMRKEKVEARRMHQQNVAREKLACVADSFEAGGARALEEAAQMGHRVQGVSTLSPDDRLTANHAGAGAEDYLGQSRHAGLDITRKAA